MNNEQILKVSRDMAKESLYKRIWHFSENANSADDIAKLATAFKELSFEMLSFDDI